jgi:hypothetical protein
MKNLVVCGRSRLLLKDLGETRPDDAPLNQSKNGAGFMSTRRKVAGNGVGTHVTLTMVEDTM